MRIKNERIHFIGLGGIGMSAVARLAMAKGARVSGSDSALNPVLAKIKKLGARVRIGHRASHLADAGTVIYSSSIVPSNPELMAARNKGIPVYHRGQFLAELVRSRKTIAVAGAHGKSTTTAMIGSILIDARLDPTVVLGAELEKINGNARYGRGSYAVVEADESDGSFLWLDPWAAVITNIDDEHLDYFRNRAEIEEAYRRFAAAVPAGGYLIGCYDDQSVRALLKKMKARVITYGFGRGARVRAVQARFSPGRTVYRLVYSGKDLGEITLKIPGRHNILNSLAAVAAAREAGVSFKVIQKTLADYQGAGRRFQVHGEVNELCVVEDYGHHPTEIDATLKAAREWGKRRVRCVFQPHRYSRTRYLMDRFSRCFRAADELILLPIYAASEEPLPGVNSRVLLRKIKTAGHRRAMLKTAPGALEYLKTTARPGDLILFLGAGDVGLLSRKFFNQLQNKSSC